MFDNRARLLHHSAMDAAEKMLAAYIGLGSNLGEPEQNLRAALARLQALPGCRLGRVSAVYATEPQGLKAQPWFANQAAELFCPAERDPVWLLRALLGIEAGLGRRRGCGLPPDSPRVIDLDLLLFGDKSCRTPELTLPHPRLTRRAFVLVPLLEIAPELSLPKGGPLRSALRDLPYRLAGRRIYQA